MKKRTLKVLIATAAILVILAAIFFFPRSQEVVVLDKIQKHSWFSVPGLAENNLTLLISTDKGYFSIRGEFDSDGIRHIFKNLEVGKKYKLDYFGIRFNPFYIYPSVSSSREVS